MLMADYEGSVRVGALEGGLLELNRLEREMT